MMLQSGLSPQFWAEAVLTANHIRNRCPSRSLTGETPFKIWLGRNPTANYFQKFGTTAYMLTSKRGPGRPKKLKTGNRGRPKKLFKSENINEVNGPESEEWKKAMKTEYEPLVKNKTWILTN